MPRDTSSLPLPSHVVKRLLDLGVPRTAASETSEEFELNYFDLTSLKIRSSHFTSIVFSRRPPRDRDLSFEDVDELVGQVESAIAGRQRFPGERRDEVFVLLIQTAKLPPVVRERRSLPRHPKIVVLDESDCRAILDSTQQRDALRTVSRACALALGALELSPYEMGAPAAGYRFFDRRALLKRVSAKPNTSITLIGSRRIGKTSVLHELKRELTSKHGDLLVAHLYGSNLDNSYEVLLRILEDTYPARVARLQLDRDEKTLWNELRKLVQSGKQRLAIFIDEFDHILDWDGVGGFRLLNLLRELSYSGNCSFYFAGFRQTLKAVEDVSNPLYNFTSAERIQPFERDATFDMVEYPLENLGVPVTVAGLADFIHRESGGQPELIQYMCNKILESFSNSGRVLTPDELSNLLTLDGKFESVIFRQTVQNISEKGLLAIVLFIRSLGEHADPATVTFTAADLIRGVQESSVACRVEVPLHFSRELAGELEIAGVITRTGSRAPITYRFTVPRMGDYLTILGLENEIQRLAKSTASL